jgi:hypothetical protein
MKRIVEKLFRSFIVLMIIFASVGLNTTNVAGFSSMPINSIFSTNVLKNSTYIGSYVATSTTNVLFEYSLLAGCNVVVSTGTDTKMTVVKTTQVTSNVLSLNVVKGSKYYFAFRNNTATSKTVKLLLAVKNATGIYQVKGDGRAVSWIAVNPDGSLKRAVFYWNTAVANKRYVDLKTQITAEAPKILKIKSDWALYMKSLTTVTDILLFFHTAVKTTVLKLADVGQMMFDQIYGEASSVYPKVMPNISQSVYAEIVHDQLEVAYGRAPVMKSIFENCGIYSINTKALTQGIIVYLEPADSKYTDSEAFKQQSIGNKEFFYVNFPGAHNGKEAMKIQGKWFIASYMSWVATDYSVINSIPNTTGFFSFE